MATIHTPIAVEVVSAAGTTYQPGCSCRCIQSDPWRALTGGHTDREDALEEAAGLIHFAENGPDWTPDERAQYAAMRRDLERV